MSHEESIEELCSEAGVGKPFVYSSWVFMRAAGIEKTRASNMIGCSRNTLTRYENKIRRSLSRQERFELVHVAFNYEYDERIKTQDNSTTTTEGEE